MIDYATLKVIHIVSSTVLFGTGLGIAFFKWIVDRTGSVSAIKVVSEKVVLADWLFTTPAIVVQAMTGIALATTLGFPITRGWVLYSIILYGIAGACWLPVVAIQMQMRNLAREAERTKAELSDQYWRLARVWFWLGVPAFVSLLGVFWLMVNKPA
jgi:uncharacterized membrane protein